MRLAFLFSLPCSAALIILSEPITVTLFQYGKFNAFDVKMTQNTLIAYAIGLIGFITVKILTPAFYSRQDLKTPVKIAFFCLIIAQLINLILLGSLKHVGLALSTGLTACLNSALLYWYLRKKIYFKLQPGWCYFLFRIFISVFFMSVILIKINSFVLSWIHLTIFFRFTVLIGICLLGMFSYFLTLYLIGFRLNNFYTKKIKK